MTALATPSSTSVPDGTLNDLCDLLSCDPALERVADRLLGGERRDTADGLILYRTRDVPTLMRLADHVRRQKVGDKAYYVHSLRLSQTNICYVGCTFCGFQRRFGEE